MRFALNGNCLEGGNGRQFSDDRGVSGIIVVSDVWHLDSF